MSGSVDAYSDFLVSFGTFFSTLEASVAFFTLSNCDGSD